MSIDFNAVPSPCYVLHREQLKRNLNLIKEVRDRTNALIILAFKGYAMWSIFPTIRKYIDGVAASSYNEARLGFEEMKTLAHSYAPAFNDKDFDEIAKFSSHITFNSISQLKRFLPKLHEINARISVGLRVNPEYSEVATEMYNPCAPGSRLGIPPEQLKTLPMHVEGLHFHTLCESGAEALKNTLKAFEEKFGHVLDQVKWINFGGGHLITHEDYNIQLLVDLIHDFKKKYNVQVILEPGAAFVWKSGYLVSEVLDIVENHGVKTAILDVSFTAHMPDTLEMPYKPRIVGATDPKEGKPTYRMGGNTCLSGDYVGSWSFDRPLTIGDKIIFEDMMHYTMVKTTMFNGVEHPSIGVWNDKEGFKLIRKFTYEDYKNRLS
jgi:carboxynorspermidine decarboxylase